MCITQRNHLKFCNLRAVFLELVSIQARNCITIINGRVRSPSLVKFERGIQHGGVFQDEFLRHSECSLFILRHRCK